MIVRLMVATSLIALTIRAGGEGPEKAVSGAACRAADSQTADEIARWQAAMRSTDPHDSLYVARVGLLHVPDSAFAVVTDAATCTRLLAEHNRDAGYDAKELASKAASSVYAIRVGSRYITWNPDFPSGEWVTHTVWNSDFVALEHYMA